MKHGLVVADGHDMGGDVISQEDSVPGFWHCCDNDDSRPHWFGWAPLDDRETVANPVRDDPRTITGRWVVGPPPAGVLRPSGLLLNGGADG